MAEEMKMTDAEKQAAWERFQEDCRNARSRLYGSPREYNFAEKGALSLAIERAKAEERERCAKIAQTWADEIKETAGLRFESATADSAPSKIRYLCLKTVARQIREGSGE